MLPRSLSARLMLATLLALLAAAVAAAAVMLMLRTSSMDDMVREELAEEVVELQEGMRVGADGTVTLELSPEVGNVYAAMRNDAAYRLTDESGHDVATSQEGPALETLLALPPGSTGMTVAAPDGDVLLRVADATFEHAGRTYHARIARSDRFVATLKDHGSKLYLRAGSVMAVLALITFTGVIYITVNRMVRPLRQASRVAARVGPRNLGARLRSDGLPSEVVPLIDAFNAALERLEQGFRVQQEFLASAAHELKTPLALLQAEIELSGAPNTALLLRDTTQMARQVHQLLHLAEVSEGHNYSYAPVQVASVIDDAVDYLSRLAAQRGVDVLVTTEDASFPPVEADAGALFVLVKNLLENALHHAPQGSVVNIVVAPDRFHVRDAGPGVGEADRSLLFKRFWRGNPKDSDGAGLGLAICMEICLSHGWSIALVPDDDAPGACFVVVTGTTA
ncbi:HAMP domain-containing sensor histidine kinase [Stenotrophomonas sp. AB1(2024)]|uniref:HAMP domain-containing sensor histidine kinase n=1 Tax=Stenotrophomonas sp. AB1(2024) TaxID=3132215 RepID=UPI0030AB3B5D